MIQKALLTGFIIALSALLAVNLASHRPEAFFLMGWAAEKLWQYETATRMFDTGLESSKKDSPVKDRLRIADGASLTNSNFDREAVSTLHAEANAAEGKEREKLEALRLLALWNARAKDALTLEWTNKKLWLYGALVAYTGSYRIDGNDDSRTNFEIVKKLLDEQVKADKENSQQKEKQDQDSGWDSRKADESDKWGSKDGEKKDEKQPEKSDSSAKGESKSAWSGKEREKNGSEEKKGANARTEPPKSWNWTNAGNPASLQGDPGGSRWSNGSVPLSAEERKELEADIKSLSELQKERDKYVRPDGQAQSQNAIPNSLRELFSGDPLFDSMLPQPDTWANGKSW